VVNSFRPGAMLTKASLMEGDWTANCDELNRVSSFAF